MAGSPVLDRLRNRAERLREHRWRTAAYVSSERHVVMGGAPRSGTTLLRRILDRHPRLCAGPETKLFVPAGSHLEWLAAGYDIPLPELGRMRRESRSQAAFIDAFAARVSRASGKDRWVEKTPMNIRNLDWIVRHFPAVSIVHVIRDGRDVVCSMRQHPDWRWVDGHWEKVLVPRSLETYAGRWVADTGIGIGWRGDSRYVEVRYEELVTDPGPTLRRVCEAIGEEAEPAWLAEVQRPEPVTEGSDRPDDKGSISAASVGRWRAELSAAERGVVSRICGSRLRELGYEP